MAFRRQRDDWDEFLKKHGPELRECGLPDFIVADKMRFLVFLDHGDDEWGLSEGRAFDARDMPHEQICRLSEIVGQIDEHYAAIIASRWNRNC